MRRQSLNVFRMRLCGAEVRGVSAGQKTLKEAVNEAMRDWVTMCAPPTTLLALRWVRILSHDGARLSSRDW